MRVRDDIVRRLQEIGVRALFGVPGGGGNLDLIDAAGRAGLPFVLTASETGGALAAMAQAEVTGLPGACLTTLGPGAASVANGVACAFLDRAPILVVTDSHAAGANGAFAHQQFDQQSFFGPITKCSGRLLPGCAEATLDEVFQALLELPPGPVHLDCPEDFESATALETGVFREAAAEIASVAGAIADSARVEALVSRARRPLVIVGLGARRPEDTLAVCAFIEQHHLPAMVTYKAKGVVPDHHASFAGIFTNAAIENPIVGASDLILGVGLDPVELLPRPWTYSQPAVYIGRWRVSNRHIPFVSQGVVDVEEGLGEISAWLPATQWDLDDVRRQVEAKRRAIDIGDGLTAQRVVRATASRLAASSRVTVDAGAHMLPATMLWPVSQPNQLLISNGLSTMGFALPAAIGAALADRDRPLVALTGDGGLLMCAGELLTAVREKLRIVVVVFNDESLSLIEVKQQRKRYQPAGVGIGGVRWPSLAGSFGLAAFSASTESELERAIEQAATVDGPSLIEARIDRTNYPRTLEVVRG